MIYTLRSYIHYIKSIIKVRRSNYLIYIFILNEILDYIKLVYKLNSFFSSSSHKEVNYLVYL